MSTEAQAPAATQVHGGRLVAQRLKAHGVSHLFTLSGGHLFSIYDGCREEGIAIVDTRHEQSAAFAAEGWAKATRTPGVCALTAGPGVTNGMSALGSALSFSVVGLPPLDPFVEVSVVVVSEVVGVVAAVLALVLLDLLSSPPQLAIASTESGIATRTGARLRLKWSLLIDDLLI